MRRRSVTGKHGRSTARAFSRRRLSLEDLEDRRLLASDLSYTAPADSSADDLTLRLNIATLELIDNNDGGNVVASQLLADTSSVIVTGADGEDDQLTVDFSSPFSVPISFAGGSAAVTAS